MKNIFKVFILLLILGSSTSLLAQPDSAPAHREKKEKLQHLLQERFINELGLSPDQSKKFSEIFKKYHQKKRELRQQMKSYRPELETAANSNDASLASQVVAKLQKTRNEIEKLDDEQFKELKSLLSPQQQAKYFLLKENMRHEMMEIKRGKNP